MVGTKTVLPIVLFVAIAGGDRGLTWSQMPPCHNNYITGVPCITSYDFGCWKRNDDDPVEHCGYGRRPIPLGQQ